MIILKRDEIMKALTLKLKLSTNDELVELYEQLYGVTPIVSEVVDEQSIQDAIWGEMHVTVTAEIVNGEVELFPDSYQELANYWDVPLWSDAYNDKVEELEEKWTTEVGKVVNIKQKNYGN